LAVLLPEPKLIHTDTELIVAEMASTWELTVGKTLYPAQPESLFIRTIAYRETLLRIAMNEAIKQNLVLFATFPMLDHLAAFWGLERLPAAAARCTLSFTLTAIALSDTLIPSGTRVRSKDGLVIFATDADLYISAGALNGETTAVADIDGILGNGYAAGDISDLLDPIANVLSVGNLDMTTAGADSEDDEHFRQRVLAAPELLSVAGPAGYYIGLAKGAHVSIIDVAVWSTTDAVVHIAPLTDVGMPSQQILDLVDAVVNDRKVRPLTDHVIVQTPTEVQYVINLKITLYSSADPTITRAGISSALDIYTADRRAGLMRDVMDSQIIAAAQMSGVERVELLDPTPSSLILLSDEWANCTSISISWEAPVNG
jgi:phage-related baseplate assembly protein